MAATLTPPVKYPGRLYGEYSNLPPADMKDDELAYARYILQLCLEDKELRVEAHTLAWLQCRRDPEDADRAQRHDEAVATLRTELVRYAGEIAALEQERETRAAEARRQEANDDRPTVTRCAYTLRPGQVWFPETGVARTVQEITLKRHRIDVLDECALWHVYDLGEEVECLHGDDPFADE